MRGSCPCTAAAPAAAARRLAAACTATQARASTASRAACHRHASLLGTGRWRVRALLLLQGLGMLCWLSATPPLSAAPPQQPSHPIVPQE